ncbi:MAG TPA: hypothetical protein VLG76_03655 [Rhabdochlamydiaceae bacterium]|nr:hypothetical protein [Rhabdochlamydiaceae bacterium]
MEELKYSFKHQIEKSSPENDHSDEDIEKVKQLRGLSRIKKLFKSQKLKNLFILQEVFKQK